MFAFIISIVALIFVFSLQGRIDELEKKLNRLEGNTHTVGTEPASIATSISSSDVPNEIISYVQKEYAAGLDVDTIRKNLLDSGWDEQTVNTAVAGIEEKKKDVAIPHEKAKRTPQTSSWTSTFTHWLAEDWLMKLGAFLVLVGVGWFVSYAFANNWIGPAGRITLGLLLGISVLLLGEWRMRRFKNQGAVLLALGAGVVLLTVFAAREMYGFFTFTTALSVMFLAVAFCGVASVRYNSKALAALSVVMSGLAPVFTAAYPGVFELFAYLLVVSVAVLWVVAATGWKFLAPLSVSLVILYTLSPFIGFVDTDKGVMFVISSLFSILYFSTNVMSVLKTKYVSIADMYVAAASGFLAILWVYISIPKEWMSIVTAAWAMLFALAAFTVFRFTRNSDFPMVYYGISAALVGVATSMELEGATLVLAYIFEISLMSVVASFVLKSVKIAQEISMLFAVPAVLSLASIASDAWSTGVIHKDFFVLLCMAAALLGVGYFFHRQRVAGNTEVCEGGVALSMIVGAWYVLGLVWLSSHAYFKDSDVATMVSLVTYTIVGIGAYIRGKMTGMRAVYLSGGVLLGFVVARLLFVEVWNMDLVGRIITFVLIGTLLISTAFIGTRRNTPPNRSGKNPKV